MGDKEPKRLIGVYEAKIGIRRMGRQGVGRIQELPDAPQPRGSKNKK